MEQVPPDLREELVSACRTTVGDELRSVTFFTEETVEQLYLRSDLESEADLVGFAETERYGFRTRADYRNSELGAYRFTVRVFDEGYVMRVIANDRGVFVTTDSMVRDRFDDLVAGVKSILRE